MYICMFRDKLDTQLFVAATEEEGLRSIGEIINGKYEIDQDPLETVEEFSPSAYGDGVEWIVQKADSVPVELHDEARDKTHRFELDEGAGKLTLVEEDGEPVVGLEVYGGYLNSVHWPPDRNNSKSIVVKDLED